MKTYEYVQHSAPQLLPTQNELETWRVNGIDTGELFCSYEGEWFVYVRPSILTDLRHHKLCVRQHMLYRLSPATVPAEWRLVVAPYSLSCMRLIDECDIEVPKNVHEQLTQFSSYEPAPAGLREIYQVNPVFVAKLAGNRIQTLWHIYVVNKGMVAYEYAAVFMWWVLLPDALYEYFLSTGLHLVPLRKKASDLSELLEVCRQQAACCACVLGKQAFYWLRKYKNLAGRRKADCDVALEAKRYHPQYNYRLWGARGAVWNRRYYLQVFTEEANRLAAALVGNMRGAQVDSIAQWWSKRLNAVASGSSSNRHLLDPFVGADERIKSGDRPNKKAVMEVVPEDLIWHILGQQPHMIARRSTKNEPGLKQRALYAVNDEAVLVSAYASQHVEKHMNFWGMCPLQRPVDVLDWWKEGHRLVRDEVWLSADYTDFNKEHSTAELCLLNLALARAWLQKYPVENIAREKAAACVWVAMAQWTRFMKDEQGNYTRILSGLFSGSRDTARDNTMLHAIYHRMIIRWLDENMPEWGCAKKVYMCGDDEDVIFLDAIAAAAYYHALGMFNWHANDSKQMCGFYSHEFLQKFPHEEKGCIGPISSMIAALCSGQWYTAPGLQQDNAVAALSDQLWELVVRGADCRKVYLLGIDLLSDYMQVREAKGKPKIKLEWWKYRLGTSGWTSEYLERALIQTNNTTALWYYPECAACSNPPQLFYHVQSTRALPHRASNAWCKRWFHLFEKYADITTYKKYVIMTKAASYGSLYHSHIQELKRKWLIQHWPKRITNTVDCYRTVDQRMKHYDTMVTALAQNVDLVRQILESQSSRVAVETTAQKLARVGADPLMYELLGGDDNHELHHLLKLHQGRRCTRISWLAVYPQLQECYLLLDPALRSFLCNTGPDNS